jgi:NAD(P)-dependent dehydrogenase (short-subunit alcohol dehydrogenase family)
VFATARRPESLSDLATEHGDVRPIALDVTSTQSIEAARAEIHEQLDGTPLRAIVNNAGVSGAGPMALVDLPEVEHVIGVNVVGALAVSQAFLPILAEPDGRIINIGSGEGFIVLPINGAYAISKHALEALSRVLRLELAPSGRYVSVIVPGTTSTPILDRALNRYDDLLAEGGPLEIYHPQIEGRRRLTERGRGSTGPGRAAQAVAKAVAAKKPRAHYYLGWDARTPAILAKLPTRLGDMALRQAVR